MEMRLEPPSALCLSNSAVGGWVRARDWRLLHRIEAPVAATVTGIEPS
jgi:hypothetical protein